MQGVFSGHLIDQKMAIILSKNLKKSKKNNKLLSL
jgi:hypothetical protein